MNYKEQISDRQAEFQDQYIQLRRREGRVYTDEEVLKLPEINGSNLFNKEWKIRKQSSERLIEYLWGKKRTLKILDVGCGNGWLSNKLSVIKSTVVIGIDINAVDLEQARRVFKKGNLQFLENTLFELEVNGFDIIVFAASIQYFENLEEVLKKAKSLLNKGGEIHIMDSHFYTNDEKTKAKERSRLYFKSVGFNKMNNYYFHHSVDDLRSFNVQVLFKPNNFFNKIFNANSPFYWICINQ